MRIGREDVRGDSGIPGYPNILRFTYSMKFTKKVPNILFIPQYQISNALSAYWPCQIPCEFEIVTHTHFKIHY